MDAVPPVAMPLDAMPLDDRGLLLGDGLFETLLWRDGELIAAAAHWARMAAGAAVLGLPAPSLERFADLAAQSVRDAGPAGGRVAVRVTLTAGSGGRGLERPAELQPRLFATAAPSPRPEAPASLTIASVRRNDASPTSRLKTLAYLDNVLARREARAAGADEAVMLNTRGELACAAAANLFWIEAGALVTPADETGCLPGVMRAQVIAAAQALGIETRSARVGVDALERAEAIFLASSLIGVRPAHLLGRPFAPHSLLAELEQAVSAYA
jgi:branched-subunit amino acid aminotransferase/4-amino-4-deoxychorismate lyase